MSGVVTVMALWALAGVGGVGGKARPRHDAYGVVRLDGVETKVRWTDGDSFNVREGAHRGHGTRLLGYNTLEAFGPVHAWGEWKPEELFELATGAAGVAAAQAWSCTTDGKHDGYRRLLVSCPELALEMVRRGYGLAYAVDGEPASPKLLEAQREAQVSRRGIWKKGVVKGVVTSVHSQDERASDAGTEAETYNRVVDTRTGQAMKRPHRRAYRTCELVCEETEGERSCMVYVPFERRYRHQPACLR
jgi:hypothetical protein